MKSIGEIKEWISKKLKRRPRAPLRQRVYTCCLLKSKSNKHMNIKLGTPVDYGAPQEKHGGINGRLEITHDAQNKITEIDLWTHEPICN